MGLHPHWQWKTRNPSRNMNMTLRGQKSRVIWDGLVSELQECLAVLVDSLTDNDPRLNHSSGLSCEAVSFTGLGMTCYPILHKVNCV